MTFFIWMGDICCDTEEFLEELLDEDLTVQPSSLSQLSGLLPSDIGLVSTIWEKYGTNRRVELLTSMVGMAEEDVELNFIHSSIEMSA